MIDKLKPRPVSSLAPSAQLISLARQVALAIETYPPNQDGGVWLSWDFAQSLAGNLNRLADEAETELAG